MLRVFKNLFLSRKFWVAVFTGGANAGVAQLGLTPEITLMLLKGISLVGATLIGSIAYEDGKTKEFGMENIPDLTVKTKK